MNKIILHCLLLLGVVFGFAACSDDDNYSPGEWNGADGFNQVSFAPTSENVELDPTDPTSHTVTITRQSTSGTLNVPIKVESDTAGVFTTNESASFADGDSVATFTVNFPTAKIGTAYHLRLIIDDPTVASLYSSQNVYDLTVTRVKWNDVGYYIDANGNKVEGYGMYTEDLITTFFNIGGTASWPVKLQERDDRHGYYRLVNVYTSGNCPFLEDGDYNHNGNFNIYIDATNPNKVFIPHYCDTGMDLGYGEVYMSSISGLRLAQGRDDDAEDYYGTYANGKITFPTSALLVAMANYQSGGFYQANGSGNFSLVIDPSKDPYVMNETTDFDWNPVYSGVFTSAQMGTTATKTLNKGTAAVKTDGCDTTFAKTYGTAYAIEAPYTEGYDLYFAVNSKGEITVPAGLENQNTGMKAVGQDVYATINSASSTFSENGVVLNITFHNQDGSLVYGTTNETIQNMTWTEVGTVDYTYSLLFNQPQTDTGLKLYKLDQDDVTYKVEHWGGDVTLQFTWNRKTNAITIPLQQSGLDDGLYISDWPGLNSAFGQSFSYNDYPCTYDPETQTATLNIWYIYLASGRGANGTETMKINLNASGAKALKTVNNKRSIHLKKAKSLGHNRHLTGHSFDWKTTPKTNAKLFMAGELGL